MIEEKSIEDVIQRILHLPANLHGLFRSLVTKREYCIMGDIAQYLSDKGLDVIPGSYDDIPLCVSVIQMLEEFCRRDVPMGMDQRIKYYYSREPLQQWLRKFRAMPSPHLEKFIYKNCPDVWDHDLVVTYWYKILSAPSVDTVIIKNRWKMICAALENCEVLPKQDVTNEHMIWEMTNVPTSLLDKICVQETMIPIVFRSITSSKFHKVASDDVNHHYAVQLAKQYRDVLLEYHNRDQNHILRSSVVRDEQILRELLAVFSPNYDRETLHKILTCEYNHMTISCYLRLWRENRKDSEYLHDTRLLNSGYVSSMYVYSPEEVHDIFVNVDFPDMRTARISLMILVNMYVPTYILEEFLERHPEVLSQSSWDYWEMIFGSILCELNIDFGISHNKNTADIFLFFMELLNMEKLVLTANIVRYIDQGFEYEGYRVLTECFLDFELFQLERFTLTEEFLKKMGKITTFSQMPDICRYAVKNDAKMFEPMIMHYCEYILDATKRIEYCEMVKNSYPDITIHQLLAPTTLFVQDSVPHELEYDFYDNIITKPMIRHRINFVIVMGEYELIDGFQWWEDGVQYRSIGPSIDERPEDIYYEEMTQEIVDECKSDYVCKFPAIKGAR